MARFARGEEHVELVLEDKAIVEGSAFGTVRRELHDARAARIAYYQRIAELLDDRWARATQFVDDLLPVDEPPFAIQDDDDIAVYTDWLIERGDPRGELAALRRAEAPDVRAIASLEKTRGLELFGPLAMLARPWRENFAYTWRRGWIDEITFQRDDTVIVQASEVMQHALHAPMARFARWLTLDSFRHRTVFECLADCPCLAQIRGVRITEGACHEHLLDVLPALEELELHDSDWINGGHPNVWRIRLTVEDGFPDLRGPFPSLRRLELVVSGSIGLARSLIRVKTDLPALRELAIASPPIPAYLLERIEEMREHMSIQVTIQSPD